MQPCVLCDPNLGPLLAEGQSWRLVLNHNQNLLGKCFLVLRRHLETVPALTADEWMDLHAQVQHATAVLTDMLAPDHFNYAFLQNQDRHVHLHIIPRYATQRHFAGLVFHDPDYPAHYSVPAPPRSLDPPIQQILAGQLREHHAKVGTVPALSIRPGQAEAKG